MKKLFKFLYPMMLLISTGIFAGCIYIAKETPSTYYTTDESHLTLSGSILPLSVKFKGDSNPVCNGNHSINANSVSVGELTLLNIFPIKSVSIQRIEERTVTPCGIPFGIKLFADGPMVISVSSVNTAFGPKAPAEESGIICGDTILTVDGKSIKTNEDLASAIELSEGKNVDIGIMREGEKINLSSIPVKSSEDEKYKLGVWVRDSSGGIGTITFYVPTNKYFCGLGHGIYDVDTGKIMSLSHGDIMEASVRDISKGERGKPGELKGAFVNTKPIGKLYYNTDSGIYGTLNDYKPVLSSLKIAMKHQVKPGPAKILTTISGKTPQYFDIKIEKINYSQNNPTKNILISVTDTELLEKSGGIVQGMSGSPIIQNDMVVGAITHVFVRNPSKGYAIFAESMLSNLNNIVNIAEK